MSEPLLIARDRIRRDGGTQPRAATQGAVVADYAEAIGNGVVLPPVTVFFDGTDYWLADGFHRDGAHEHLGLVDIACDVRTGTRRDAVLFAVGANDNHGLRRSNDDKRRAVLILLDDVEWQGWSDSEIARRCRVSHTFVAKLRPLTCNVSGERTYVTRHGTVATMDVAAMGKRAADYATIRSLDERALYRVLVEQKAAKQAAKLVRREEREADLGDAIAAGNAALGEAAAQGKRFGVVLADPEWRYEPWSRVTGMDRAPENHYPTTPTSEICARPVGELAADDCALFLWATAPMLPDAFRVMDAWGFTYKTHAVWLKKRAGQARGPGYWLTGEHEILLLGTRGNPPAPAPGQQWRSAFIAPIGRHSEKPERVYELIEAYFPNLPKIELNARMRRAGWEAWGAEVPDAEPVPALGGPRPEELDDLPDPAPAAELPALPARSKLKPVRTP